MKTERFNLDLDAGSYRALERIRGCMEATSDSEVIRRVLQEWRPGDVAHGPIPNVQRHRLHLRLPEAISVILRDLAVRTKLTYPGVVGHALAAFLPLVDAYEVRVASGVRSSEPPPFI